MRLHLAPSPGGREEYVAHSQQDGKGKNNTEKLFEDDSGSRAEACSENNFSVLFLPEVEFVYSVNNIMFKAILLTCSLIIFFKL